MLFNVSYCNQVSYLEDGKGKSWSWEKLGCDSVNEISTKVLVGMCDLDLGMNNPGKNPPSASKFS